MKALKYIMLGMAISFILACNSENEEDLSPDDGICMDNSATLSGAISTIINTNCAVPGCHVSGTGRANSTVKVNIIQYASQIRTFTQNRIIRPPSSGETFKAQKRKIIFCGVKMEHKTIDQFTEAYRPERRDRFEVSIIFN